MSLPMGECNGKLNKLKMWTLVYCDLQTSILFIFPAKQRIIVFHIGALSFVNFFQMLTKVLSINVESSTRILII